MSAPSRTGTLSFGDAYLSIWEEPGVPLTWGNTWEPAFKRDVFARIVQTLNRLGWTCTMPPVDECGVKAYGGDIERYSRERKRFCVKGDLKADLEMSGRAIKFDMFQSVNCPTRPDYEGRYERDKEACMPYLMRLEMERTRRRIRDYLCNVFDGYSFTPKELPIGFNGVTATEAVERKARASGHYNPKLGHASGADASYNNRSADGGIVVHGAKVWTTDRKGRLVVGTAHYYLNNMWRVITGRYAVLYPASSEIFVNQPGDLRTKRNAQLRQQRLRGELDKAVKAMNFERAAVLRDILHPAGPTDACVRGAA